MNLFIDTSNWNFVLILEAEGKVLDHYEVLATKKVSDLLIEGVQSLLAKHGFIIHDIENFYLTIGPGSYTGERVGLTMVKTLKTLNPKFQVYTLNSLAYQAGMGQKISLLDARGGKSYLGIYDDQQPKLAEQVINQTELNAFLESKGYTNYAVVQDYESLDFVANYLQLKPFFTLVDNAELLVPFYLKSYI